MSQQWTVLRFAGLCAGLLGCSSHELSRDLPAPPTDERRPIVTSLAEPNTDHLEYRASIRGGEVVDSKVSNPLPARVISTWTPYPDDLARTATKDLAEVLDVPTARLDTLLEVEVASGESGVIDDRLIEVLVTFKETFELPRFPSLRDQPRDSAENFEVAARNAALITLIEEARAQEHATHAAELVEQYGATVEETFWLANAMKIELPLSQVRALEQHADVQFIERTDKPEAAPPAATMLDVRTLENSDKLRAFGGGYIGLLDTGVRLTHQMLPYCTSTRKTGCRGIVLDCYNGTAPFCNTGANRDPADRCNHGTGSAGELIGVTSNDANRGMTQAVVDSMKVYSPVCGFSVDAGLRGFEAAARWGDNVIVAEIQDSTGGPSGSISAAANSAFDANRMVVAAAGNRGPSSGTVTAPGSARKVLAVGAIDTSSQVLIEQSGRGPIEGRTKPDLVGLTNITVPSNASDTAMKEYTGTSAATPNVAGLTTLIWNALNRPAPGIVYASMLAIGNNTGSSDNDYGAGLPRWPGTAEIIASSVSVTSSTVEVTINVSTAWNLLNVAIWWPEISGHKNIDLYLVRPTGAIAASSTSTSSVFEKVAVSPVATGNWKIRLVPPLGSSATRTVYYAWSPQKW